MRVLHSWTDLSAIIAVEGLSRPLRVLHLSDSHVALIDERDADFIPCCRGLGDRFLHRHQNLDERGQPIPPQDAFTRTMTSVGAQELDLIALTGDAVDFPAQAAVDHVLAALETARAPMCYTAGNHDWLFHSLAGTAPLEVLRATWRPALARLYQGDPDCSLLDLGGVRFLAIDNSTYQISEKQLEFTRASLDAGLPTVILSHIPLSIATLRAPTLEIKNSPVLMADPDWDIEDRGRYFVGSDTAETLAFVRLVAKAENLLAILCGHIHFAHVDSISPQAVQYVGGPGFAGAYRLLELRPL